MSLAKYKPAVSRNWLIIIAGILWSAVGIMLLRLAITWLYPLEQDKIILFFSAGTLFAFVFYRIVFSGIAEKNILRICEFSQKGCLFAFQPWRSYLLIILMISLGVILRNSFIPKRYLAVIYISVGGGLFLASIKYYIHLLRGRG
jgi:hypothetical protein